MLTSVQERGQSVRRGQKNKYAGQNESCPRGHWPNRQGHSLCLGQQGEALAFLSTAWSPSPSIPQLPTLPPPPYRASSLQAPLVLLTTTKSCSRKLTDFILMKKQLPLGCYKTNILKNAQGFRNMPSFTLNREKSPCGYTGSVELTFTGKTAYFVGLTWVCPLQDAESPVATLPTPSGSLLVI